MRMYEPGGRTLSFPNQVLATRASFPSVLALSAATLSWLSGPLACWTPTVLNQRKNQRR